MADKGAPAKGCESAGRAEQCKGGRHVRGEKGLRLHAGDLHQMPTSPAAATKSPLSLPHLCQLRGGGGLRRLIGDWEAYRGVRGNTFPSLLPPKHKVLFVFVWLHTMAGKSWALRYTE